LFCLVFKNDAYQDSFFFLVEDVLFFDQCLCGFVWSKVAGNGRKKAGSARLLCVGSVKIKVR
jgi:hypothetical protein